MDPRSLKEICLKAVGSRKINRLAESLPRDLRHEVGTQVRQDELCLNYVPYVKGMDLSYGFHRIVYGPRRDMSRLYRPLLTGEDIRNLPIDLASGQLDFETDHGLIYTFRELPRIQDELSRPRLAFFSVRRRGKIVILKVHCQFSLASIEEILFIDLVVSHKKSRRLDALLLDPFEKIHPQCDLLL